MKKRLKRLRLRVSKVVLVVDKDHDTRGAIQYGLEYLYPTKYNVICVSNEKRCFDLLNNFCNPDVILLNIMLPGMDGWSIYEKLKRGPDFKHIPIVFLSEKKDKVARTAGETLQELYLEKPFAISELVKTINELKAEKIKVEV